MDSGRVSPTHVLAENRYGITCKFSVTSKPKRILLEKQKELAGLAGATYELTVKLKPRRDLYGIHNDFSGVGGSDV